MLIVKIEQFSIEKKICCVCQKFEKVSDERRVGQNGCWTKITVLKTKLKATRMVTLWILFDHIMNISFL